MIVQVIGDDVFCDGEKVAVLKAGFHGTVMGEFCDALNDLNAHSETQREIEFAEAREEGETEGYQRGRSDVVEEIRETINNNPYADVDHILKEVEQAA